MTRRAMAPGFTLLELLVAGGLFVLVLVTISKVVSHSLDLSSRVGAEVRVRQTARLVLEIIRRDIAAAALPVGRAHSLEFRVNPLPDTPSNGDAAFWQLPAGDDSEEGGFAVVGYFAAGQFIAGSEAPRFELRRVYIEPDRSPTPAEYLIYSRPNDWMPQELRERFGPNSAGESTNRGWVADGVLGLWLRALDNQGRMIPGGSAGVYRYDSKPSAAMRGALPSRLPAMVEVIVVCMSPGEYPRLRKVPTPPSGADADSMDALEAVVDEWVESIREENPGVHSIGAFRRRFRLYLGE